MGSFISERNSEKLNFNQFKQYFEMIGTIIRENDFVTLRDHTQWILVPSMYDPGQTKLLPSLKLSESLI